MEYNDAPVTQLNNRKAEALLYYLAIEAEAPLRRGELAIQLMPLTTDDPRAALRGVIRDLRTALGEPAQAPNFLLADRHAVERVLDLGEDFGLADGEGLRALLLRAADNASVAGAHDIINGDGVAFLGCGHDLPFVFEFDRAGEKSPRH